MEGMGVFASQIFIFRVFETASLVNLHSSVKNTCRGNWGSSTQQRRNHIQKLGVQNWLDPLPVTSGDGKGVVAAHAEPPRWYYEAHPIPRVMVQVIVNGVFF